jgi:hypothetical protein
MLSSPDTAHDILSWSSADMMTVRPAAISGPQPSRMNQAHSVAAL